MRAGFSVSGARPAISGTDNFSASVKRVRGEHENQCPDVSVQQIDPKALAENNPSDPMSHTASTYSEHTLQKIALFFAHYKPSVMDREWAEERKAEVAAEIKRRKEEDKESHQ